MPETAREEAITKAEAGEHITKAEAAKLVKEAEEKALEAEVERYRERLSDEVEAQAAIAFTLPAADLQHGKTHGDLRKGGFGLPASSRGLKRSPVIAIAISPA